MAQRPLEDMQAHFADAEREGVLEQIEAARATAGKRDAVAYPRYCAGAGCPVVECRSIADFDAARRKRSKPRPSSEPDKRAGGRTRPGSRRRIHQ